MKFLAFLSLFFCVCLASNTQSKINTNQKNLKNNTQEEHLIKQKINSIAKDILDAEKSLLETNSDINTLQRQIQALNEDNKATITKLKDLQSQNQNLAKSRQDLENQIIKLIAEKFSFYLISDKNYQDNIESIIGNEALIKIDSILKKDFQELSRQFNNTSQIITKHNEQIEQIHKSLKELKDKQVFLKELKNKRAKNVTQLKDKKSLYKTQLEKIVRQRNELLNTLKELKIIKAQEDEERLNEQHFISSSDTDSKLSVKQLGSSYIQGKVKKYNGAKSIAPLENFIVKEKFGNYIDPIYKIKIFNESVVLQSKTPNAKVSNILDGKVIFAKDTALLDKVVIVENRLGIHTIYANLSQIAPTIKVGKFVKKGYVLGRIKSELTFEVTQKNYHINPLELIRY